MKLRTRLFLWIGLLFCLAFVASYLETRIAKKNLKEGQEELHKTVLEILEAKREHLENYLNVVISDHQADLDALLLHIARDPNLAKLLFLDPPYENRTAAVWVNEALLFITSNSLAFVQTTHNEQLPATIVPVDIPLKRAQRFAIEGEKDLTWIFSSENAKQTTPYLGVRLYLKEQELKGSIAPHLLEELVVEDWAMYALFKPEMLLHFFPPNVLDSQVDFISPDMEHLRAALTRAQTFLRGKARNAAELKAWINKNVTAALSSQIKGSEESSGVECHHFSLGRELNRSLLQMMQKRQQSIMIAALTNLLPSGFFGSNPLSAQMPLGIAHFHNETEFHGDLVLGREVFFIKKFFNDEAYYAAHPSNPDCDGVASASAIITSSQFDRVFIGNTLKMQQQDQLSYLTLGLDSDILLNQLALALNETVLLVHDNQVMSAMSDQGDKLERPAENFILTSEILTNKSGILNWGEKRYFYLKMTPFTDVDLHFYAIEPEKEAFIFENKIEQNSQGLLKDISKNMRLVALGALLIALYVLHKVSVRITRPVTLLAQATHHVAEGKLENIELPTMPVNHHDEISSLVDSFNAMVKGLKEKEKVKGVLNKVVSKEIAQEILKGTIHLGGEEKQATMLFADIRDFTHLSNGIAPHLVIEMLNACMTRVSHVIDEFGGVIDKYVGDEVMALFGAPLAKADSALKAVLCALEIVQVLKNWNVERQAQSLPPIEMGIGIHTGKVLVGNMGAENRLNYTVIGSNVNLAARLCSAAKGMQILISEHTLAEPGVKEQIVVEALPPMPLKGFDEKVAVFAITSKKNV